MYSGTTVPKVKNIYIYSPKKKRKKKKKKKIEKSVLEQVLPVQLVGKSTVVKFYRYNLKFYRYNCMELVGIVQEFNLYARALFSTNQNGKITLEGAING